MDQIVNQASKIRYMFGGQARLPGDVPLHAPAAASASAAQHSQSPYSMWMHLAGLKIILPVDAGRREGPAQERDPRQQPRGLVRVQPARRGDGAGARRRAPGADRRGRREARGHRRDDRRRSRYYVPEALAVAEELAREGISVEVIDPRTLVPLDVETIRASVRKTGRVVDRGRGAADVLRRVRDRRAASPRTRRRSAPCARRCAASARRRCPCPTARRWSRPRCRRATTSRRRYTTC